jgi:hypothetical protein
MTATRLVTLFTVFALLLGAGGAAAQDTGPGGEGLSVEVLAGAGFTYQGELRSGGNLHNGLCDFQFSLFDALNAGVQQGSTQTVTNVTVAGGRFTVVLNSGAQFGARAFDGSARWLAIAVRCPAGSGGYTALIPRQALTAAPLALALPGLRTEINVTSPNVVGGYISNTVSGGVTGATIGGGGSVGSPNVVTANNATVGGGDSNTASGSGAAVSGGYGNSASANWTTIAGGYLNTTNNMFAAVGGGYGNTASGAAATVGGGGYIDAGSGANVASGAASTIGGGGLNTASGYVSTVAGGGNNQASNTYASVGGGRQNTASGERATVGGGQGNLASGAGATVGGGGWNGGTINGNQARGTASTVAGGWGNVITTSAAYGAIGGGQGNSASGSSATVGGGANNNASGNNTAVGGGVNNTASGGWATVGGGFGNTASGSDAVVGGGTGNTASGVGATVPGGQSNLASGDTSFAAGNNARATHTGSFVWACNACATTYSPGNHTFTANAINGFWFGSAPAGTITPTLGAGTFISTSTGARLTFAGVWTNASDHSLKTDFAPVDGVAVLNTLMGLPVTSWTYKVEDAGIRHIGPTAQDFYAAFGLGDSDSSIGTVDADGVALAAIQGLYAVVQEQQAENAALRERVAALESVVETPRRDVSTGGGYGQLWLGLLLGAGIGAGAFALGRRGRTVGRPE